MPTRLPASSRTGTVSTVTQRPVLRPSQASLAVKVPRSRPSANHGVEVGVTACVFGRYEHTRLPSSLRSPS